MIPLQYNAIYIYTYICTASHGQQEDDGRLLQILYCMQMLCFDVYLRSESSAPGSRLLVYRWKQASLI